MLRSKQWYAAKRFYEACKIPICPASSLESSWQSLGVRASNVPFQSCIILDRSVATNERASICITDQWEVRKTLLTIVWSRDNSDGASSESNSDPFPAWSSHSLLVKLSQKLWPIRGSASHLSANQRPENLTPLEPDWAGNDVWDVHCRMGQDCMQGMLQALQWNMSLSSLALLRWWPHTCSDAQGENSVGNSRSSGNYKLDAAVKMMLWSQQCFCQSEAWKVGGSQ